MENKKSFKVSLLCSALFLAGCGQEEVPPPPPIGEITGNAVDALIVGGEVRAYTFNDGEKGDEVTLSPAITDDKGYFKIDVQTNHDQPIVLEVKGGYYIEEASGRTITLNDNQFLRAVYNYQHGSDVNMMVTTWTHLAAADASFRIKSGENPSSAVNTANKAISDYLDVDIVTTYPVNITDPSYSADGFYDGIKYGLVSAGLSQWTYDLTSYLGLNAHSTINSITLSNIMYNDLLSDGVLDGVVDGAKVVVDGVDLSADIYRQQIGVGAVKIVQRDVNKVGISLEESIPYLVNMSQSTIAIFSDDTPLPFDDVPPIINLANSETPFRMAHKDTTFDVTINDLVGIEKVELLIDDLVLDTVLASKAASLTFDSTQYPDGQMSVVIRATDVMGNVSEIQHNVTIANDDLAVAILMNGRYAAEDLVFKGEVYNAAPPFNVTVNGSDAEVIDNTQFQLPVNLTEGVNTITGHVIDALDRSTDFTQTIEVDLTAPTVSILPSSSISLMNTLGEMEEGVFPSDNSQLIYIGYDTVDLGLTPLTRSALDEREIVYLEIQGIDEGEVNSPKSNLTFDYSFSVNGETIVSHRTLKANDDEQVLFPLTSEFLTGLLSIKESDEITLSFYVTDEVGNIGEYHHTVALYIDLPVINQKTMFTGEATFRHYQSPNVTSEIVTCRVDSNMLCETKFTESSFDFHLSAENGDYIDIDGKHWPLEQPFSTLVDFFEEDKNIYFTPLSAGYIGSFDFNYAKDSDEETAINYARNVITGFYSFDPLATDVGVLCQNCELTPEIKHALYLAGFGVLAEQHNITPMDIMETMKADLAFDGYLNGVGSNGEIYFENGHQITHEFYRSELAHAINYYHASIGKPLGNTAVGEWAQEISLKLADVFDPNDEPQGMDNDNPFVETVTHFGEWVKGQISIDVVADDEVGIAQIALYWSSFLLDEAFNTGSTRFDVDTTRHEDGENQVEIKLTDDVNNQSSLEGVIYVDNTKPVLSNANITQTWIAENYELILDIEEISPYTHKLHVNNVEIAESEGNSVIFDTTVYEDGELNVVSKVTDSVELSSEITTRLNIDNTPPTVSASNLVNTWQKGAVEYQSTVEDISPTQVEIKVDETIAATVSHDEFATINTAQFSDGMHTITSTAIDSTEHKTVLFEQVGFDNTAPIIYESSILDKWYEGNIGFHATIEEVSPYTNTVTINGYRYGVYDTDSLTIASRDLIDGIHQVDFNVEDSVGLTKSKSFNLKVDNYAPVIADSPLNGTWQTGTFTFTAEVTEDNNYTNQVRVNDIKIQLLDNEDTFQMNTTPYDDGQHVMSYEVEDASGRISRKSFNVGFDNNEPVYTVSGMHNTWQKGVIDFIGVVQDASPTVSNVTIDGLHLTTVGNDETFTIDTLNHEEGLHAITLNATDSVGLTASRTESIGFDNSEPVFTASNQANTWKKGTFEYLAKYDDVSPTDVKLYIDDVIYKTFEAGETATISTTDFADGMRNIRIDATDSVGFNKTHTEQIGFDNTVPVIRPVSVSEPWHTGTVTFVADIDEVSPYTNTVTINGANPRDITGESIDINTTSLSDGVYTLNFDVTDSVGLNSDRDFVFKVDNYAPVIADSPLTGSWQKSNFDFYAEITEGNEYTNKVSIDGILDSTVDSDHVVSISTSRFPDGEHIINFDVEDASGKTATKSFAVNFDNTAPVIYDVAERWYEGETSFSAPVTEISPYTNTVTINGGVPQQVNTNNITLDTLAIGEGIHVLKFDIEDSVGLTSSKNFNLKIDNYAPVIGDSTHEGVQSSIFNFTVPVTEDNDYTTDVFINDVKEHSLVNSSTFSFNPSLYADGIQNVRYSVKDASGKVVNKNFTVETDHRAPVLGELTHVGTWQNGTINHSLGINDYGRYTAEIEINETLVKTLDNINVYAFDTAAYTDGTYSVKWRVVDAVGLTSTKSGTFYFDNTVPVISSWPDHDNWQKGNVSFDIELSDISPLSTVLSIGSSNYTGYTDSVKKTFTAGSIANGVHSAKVVSTDAAGNTNQSVWTLKVDRQVPSLSADKAIYEELDITSKLIGGNISDAHSGIQSVKVNGQNATVSGGRWNFTATNLQEGTNNYSVVALDNAGNSSSTNVTINLSVTPSEIMAGVIKCNGTSIGSFPMNGSGSCTTASASAAQTINLTATFSQCAGSNTCSVTWSGSGVSSSGVISRTLDPVETETGVVTATMRDSANNHTITFAINWSMTRTGECTPGDTQNRSFNPCQATQTLCERGNERRSCGVDSFWGEYETTFPGICVTRGSDCP